MAINEVVPKSNPPLEPTASSLAINVQYGEILLSTSHALSSSLRLSEFSLDVVSLFAYSVGLGGLGRVVVFSFLATQLIVWLLEIRAVGFRTWMHDSKTQSYVGYIRRYGRHEW